MMNVEEIQTMARMLAGLSDPTRLQIAVCLLERPHYVGELSQLLQLPIVNVSHHLGVMKQAGIVEGIKQGRKVLYRFRDGLVQPSKGDNAVVLQLNQHRVVLSPQLSLEPVAAPASHRGRRTRRPSSGNAT